MRSQESYILFVSILPLGRRRRKQKKMNRKGVINMNMRHTHTRGKVYA